MRKKAAAAAFIGWAILPLAARAEYGCQQGFVPVYQGNQQVCVADYNLPSWQQGQRATQQSSQRWESRWGAIALDERVSAFGITEQQVSKRQAKAVAIADCKAHGGSKCVAWHYYTNQCVAMIAFDGGYDVLYGLDKTAKESEGLAKCTSAGKSSCRVYYSGCSKPVALKP